MRQRKSKRILTLLVALAVMLSLCTTAYAETESSASAEPTASEQATETTGTAEPSAEASPSAAESAEPTETPEPSQPAQSEAPSGSAEQEITDEPAVADLSSVNSVSEVAALSETGDAEGTDGLVMNKTAAYDEETNSYTITLEQYVTGSVSTVTTTKPADIVLVLDVSGSMDYLVKEKKVYNSDLDKSKTYYIKLQSSSDKVTPVTYSNGSWGYYNSNNRRRTVNPKVSQYDYFGEQFYEGETRLNALKTAVNNFIDSVAKNATEKNVDHRIAIVTYASSANTRANLTSVNNNVANVTFLKNTVSGLSANGATAADYGMEYAQTVLNSADENSTKVVVMFTDGEPNHGQNFDGTVANTTIKEAKEIKDSGATVYTIGMLSGADDTLPAPDGSSDADKINRYMHYVSSNYPDATSMSKGENMADGVGGDTGKSFYLAADSAEKLNDIFQQISHSVNNPSIKLGTDTVVKDTVTQYFNMPNVSDVSVYTANCTGKDSNGNYTFGDGTKYTGATVAIDKDNNAITVTNFDYAENYVNSGADGKTYGGKKLIVEFTITPKAGFLGGNNVPTNGDDSGIYANSKAETAIKNYTIPEVNVPVKEIAVDVVDKNVYLYGDVTQAQMLEGATVTVTDTNGNSTTLTSLEASDNYGLDEWQNAFVTINVVTKPEGQTGLTADSTFSLSASMAANAEAKTEIGPKNTETKTDSDSANIFVFKPELTFRDGEVDYLDNAPTDYNVYKVGETAWKHNNTLDTSVTMLGTAPELGLTYTPGTGIDSNGVITFKDKDIPVQVTVKINGTEVNSFTTFVHDDCKVNGCTWSENNKNGDPAFLLHPKNTVLTIAKTVSGGEANPNEHFTFTITGEALKGRIVDATIIGADGCSEEHNHGITDAKLTFSSYGTATVYLKHGEEIKLEGLKAGEVTIAEENGEYTLTAEVNDANVDVSSNSSIGVTLNRGETTKAELDNKLGGTVITGIDSDNAPFIIIGAAVVICAAGFVFLRRRRGRSDF